MPVCNLRRYTSRRFRAKRCLGIILVFMLVFLCYKITAFYRIAISGGTNEYTIVNRFKGRKLLMTDSSVNNDTNSSTIATSTSAPITTNPPTSASQNNVPATKSKPVPSTTSTTAEPEASGDIYPEDMFTLDQLRDGAVLLHCLGVLYMFMALAIVCDEFFVPALGVITQRLEISEDVAGATFMAAGGSAPELFTSLIGTFFSKNDVGIGTIVGSAVFNILFVIGMCSFYSLTVLTLTWWPLFRDVCFYSMSLAFLIGFFLDSQIQVWESVVLFLCYISYVTFMKFNEKIEGKITAFVKAKFPKFTGSKADADEDLRKSRIRLGSGSMTYRQRKSIAVLLFTREDEHEHDGETDSASEEPHSPREKKESTSSKADLQQGPIPSVHIDHAKHPKPPSESSQNGTTDLDNDTSSVKSLTKHQWHSAVKTVGMKSHSGSESIMSQQGDVSDTQSVKDVSGANSPDGRVGGSISVANRSLSPRGSLNPSHPTQRKSIAGSAINETMSMQSRTSVSSVYTTSGSIHPDPSDKHSVSNYPASEKDDESKMHEGGDTLSEGSHTGSNTHSTKGKECLGDVIDEEETPLDMSFPTGLRARANYILLFPILFSLWVTLPDVRRDTAEKFFIITFVGSIVWIGGFSFMMVWWANTIGNAMGIPAEIMGITLLAAGTSVPDLITSVIVAKKGFGDMAVSSSVGSNIFDITVGLPVPWLLQAMVTGGEAYKVGSKGLFCSIILLFGMLIAVITSIAASGWRMKKQLGVAMMVLYLIFVTMAVLLTKDIINCDDISSSVGL